MPQLIAATRVTEMRSVLLLCLPDAIIARSWAPIMGCGGVGGVMIGLIVGKYGP